MRIQLRKMIDPEYINPNATRAHEKRVAMGEEEFSAWYKTRVCEPVMTEIDSLPLTARLLVHEYGYASVRKWLKKGSISEIIRALALDAPDLDI